MDGMQSLPEEIRRYIQRLEEENKELKEKIKELENRLRLYENPHTPSSQQRFKRSSGGQMGSTGKRGAPKGHRDATRKIRKPDEVIPVPADRCPRCGCDPGESKGVETVITDELPPPRRIRVIQYEL